MKQIRLLILLALVATALGMPQQDQTTVTVPAESPQGTTVIVKPEPIPPPVTILTPAAGQTVAADYVHLRFELARPALSGEPNFLVQLDSHDPVTTSETSYTFSDVEPGVHTIRVTLVDANNIPIEGGTATVQFRVQSQQPAQNGGPSGAAQSPRGGLNRNRTLAGRTLAGAAPAEPIPPELRNDGDPNLPLAGSPLPLLSLIGFGLLIGGAAQAMRMR